MAKLPLTTALVLALALAGASHASEFSNRMLRVRRNTPHDLARRQAVVPILAQPTLAAPSAPVDATTPSPSTSPPGVGGIINTIIDGVGGKTTSSPISSAVPLSSDPSPLSSIPTTTTTPSNTAASAPTSKANQALSVINVTQTSTISDASTSAEAASASASAGAKNSDGSGIGKGTLVAIIVIASCVGAVAAIWTIIRKWKFSPSRRFEDKLNPVDFDPSADILRDANSPFPLNHSPSIGVSRSGSVTSSSGGHLARKTSWGSAGGSRTGMSEAGYDSMAPSYPPTWQGNAYVDPNYSSVAPPLPPPSRFDDYNTAGVGRQATVRGGTYGESYGRY